MSPHFRQLSQSALLFALSLATLTACSKEKFSATATTGSTAATTTATTAPAAATTSFPMTTAPTSGSGSSAQPPTQTGDHIGQRPPRREPKPRLAPLPGEKSLGELGEIAFPIRLVCANPIAIVDPVLPMLTDVRQIPSGQLVLRNLQLFKAMSDGEAVSAGVSDFDGFALHIDCGVVKIAPPGVPPIGLSARTALAEWESFAPTANAAVAAREIALKIENGRLLIARSAEISTGVAPPLMRPMSYEQFTRPDGRIVWMRSYAPTPTTWDLRIRIDRVEPGGRSSSEYMRGLYEVAHL